MTTEAQKATEDRFLRMRLLEMALGTQVRDPLHTAYVIRDPVDVARKMYDWVVGGGEFAVKVSDDH